ncbi:hypothetical protein Poly30_01700 [Planctomycetes bacterium Poly30]|uniref:Uncharacterized protein n=1 Tax=Saltatorellus ferox TaxID=2528018 RepID=A0A518EKQ5_9BACT|nr:hypothetical protein Poly30_01700 [Planctomycetes bacterium Poly30]
MTDPTNHRISEPAGSATARVLAGLAGAVIVVAGATFAAGPPRKELITHDDALPYRTDRKGRTDTPFEILLAEQKPEVVVVGSSIVACAFDEAAFEKQIGMEALDLTVAGSMSATWYLVIKNRIAAANPPPKYCILGFRDTYLTVPEYRADGGYKQIVDRYVDGPEPLLDRLAYLSDLGPLEYTLRRYWAPAQRKSEIVERVEGFVKADATGFLLGHSPDEMRAAVDVVFADDRKQPSKLTKKQRRAAKLAMGNYFDFESELPESFLPEMVRICREAGIQLVLMRMRPRRNAEFPDDRSHFPTALKVDLPRYERALEAYLASESVPLLDFSEDDRIPFEWFANGDHLNREEARVGFTELLSEAFLALVARLEAQKKD